VKNADIAIKISDMRKGTDSKSFEELYKDLKTPVYTIIFRITWNKALSEDILQEVFLKLYLSPPAAEVKNPRAYIFRIARNLAIDSVRKQGSHISLDEIGDAVHQPLDDIPLKMDIENALKALPEQERQLVTLHINADLKFREISEILDMPLGTALWKYRKAISKLQKYLGGSL